jgi:hypothetical protein
VQQWKYDSSGTGAQVWPPQRADGLWKIPMQGIPFPGHSFEVISMDYNMHPVWKAQARDCFLAEFRRAYHGNRAR